jgi:hypothetical protein
LLWAFLFYRLGVEEVEAILVGSFFLTASCYPSFLVEGIDLTVMVFFGYLANAIYHHISWSIFFLYKKARGLIGYRSLYPDTKEQKTFSIWEAGYNYTGNTRRNW